MQVSGSSQIMPFNPRFTELFAVGGSNLCGTVIFSYFSNNVQLIKFWFSIIVMARSLSVNQTSKWRSQVVIKVPGTVSQPIEPLPCISSDPGSILTCSTVKVWSLYIRSVKVGWMGPFLCYMTMWLSPFYERISPAWKKVKNSGQISQFLDRRPKNK